MTDEELEKRLSRIRGEVTLYAIALFMVIVISCVGIILITIHIQTILCEQKPVQSCPK